LIARLNRDSGLAVIAVFHDLKISRKAFLVGGRPP